MKGSLTVAALCIVWTVKCVLGGHVWEGEMSASRVMICIALKRSVQMAYPTHKALKAVL